MAIQYEPMITSTVAPSPTDALLAGSSMPRVDKPVTIATGQTALKRGTILMSSGAKAVIYDAVDPTTIVGILAIDTPAATGDVPSYMWVTGELSLDVVTTVMGGAPSTATLAQLEKMNIYLKKVAS